jgi:TolB protein
VQDLQRGTFNIVTRTDMDESPSVAPNGSMVIYGTQHGGTGVLEAVSIDGRVKVELPSKEGEVREPAWSPFL